jgi:hypothetical protein
MEDKNPPAPHAFLVSRYRDSGERITFEIDENSTLPEAIGAFERFLKAVQYSIPDGKMLDIVGGEE